MIGFILLISNGGIFDHRILNPAVFFILLLNRKDVSILSFGSSGKHMPGRGRSTRFLLREISEKPRGMGQKRAWETFGSRCRSRTCERGRGRKGSWVAWGRTGLRRSCSYKKVLASPAGSSGTEMTLLGVHPMVGLERPLTYHCCAQSGLAWPAKRVASAGDLRQVLSTAASGGC